jgi:hypothetical protein
MVSTCRQRQALVAVTNPLRDAGILQQVFTFLPGHWLFLGAVCSEWNAVYAGIAEQRVRSLKLDYNAEPVTCGIRTTLYSAAVASPATVRLALSSGPTIRKNEKLQLIAGLLANTATLTALRGCGMSYTKTVSLYSYVLPVTHTAYTL